MTGRGSDQSNRCTHPDCQWDACDGRHLVMHMTVKRNVGTVDLDIPLVLFDIARERGEWVRGGERGFDFKGRTAVNA